MTTENEGKQAGAFPGRDDPHGSIIPPTAAAMENKTYVTAGPEIEKLANRLINEWDRLEDLRGTVIGFVWSRNQTRSVAGEQVLAWAHTTGILEAHYGVEAEAQLPACSVVLSYKAADKWRTAGRWLHPELVERELARALCGFEVSDGGVITIASESLVTYPELIGRYGLHTEGERTITGQLELFAERDASRRPGGPRTQRAPRTTKAPPAASSGEEGLSTPPADPEVVNEEPELVGASEPSS